MAKAATQAIPPADLDALRSAYTFRDEAAVLAFLEQYPFLVPLLLEAPKPIHRHFPSSPLVLEVVADDDEQRLVLSTATHLKPADTIERMNRVGEEWWLDATDNAQGKLLVDLL